jgi:hypothetical protein
MHCTLIEATAHGLVASMEWDHLLTYESFEGCLSLGEWGLCQMIGDMAVTGTVGAVYSGLPSTCMPCSSAKILLRRRLLLV